MRRQVILVLALGLCMAPAVTGLHLDRIDPTLALAQVAVLCCAAVAIWVAWPPTADGDHRKRAEQAAAEIEALLAAIASQEIANTRVIEEHAAVVREIHHRVKNNLQIVYSLLDLQMSRLTSSEARQALTATRMRVSTLALLHRHLYGDKDFYSVEMRTFVTELCNHLSAIEDGSGSSRVEMSVSVEEVRMIADQAVGVGLIITEAALNARQHAFPGDRAGVILVDLTVTPDRAALTIADNGRGLDASRPVGNGIGGTLIRGFVKQIGGTLTMSGGNGTTVTVHFTPQTR